MGCDYCCGGCHSCEALVWHNGRCCDSNLSGSLTDIVGVLAGNSILCHDAAVHDSAAGTGGSTHSTTATHFTRCLDTHSTDRNLCPVYTQSRCSTDCMAQCHRNSCLCLSASMATYCAMDY